MIKFTCTIFFFFHSYQFISEISFYIPTVLLLLTLYLSSAADGSTALIYSCTGPHRIDSLICIWRLSLSLPSVVVLISILQECFSTMASLLFSLLIPALSVNCVFSVIDHWKLSSHHTRYLCSLFPCHFWRHPWSEDEVALLLMDSSPDKRTFGILPVVSCVLSSQSGNAGVSSPGHRSGQGVVIDQQLPMQHISLHTTDVV